MSTRAAESPRLPGAGERVLQGKSRWGLLPFLGPAFIACVAYMDPGNFATNIAGGSKFGFTVPDEFFVGYGFDVDGRWRNLPDLRLAKV